MASFLQWNCRGFYRNYPFFKVLLSEMNPSVIALQETKFKPKADIKGLRAYTPYSKPYTGGVIASGGAALFIKTDLIQTEIPLNTQLQAVAARVTIHNRPISAISLYLNPDDRISLQQLNQLVSQVPPPYLIMGDLNAHNPMWGGHSRDPKGRLIEEFIRVNNLVLFNDRRPTWECISSGRSSTIDLTLGHPSLRVSFDWDILPNKCGSDHFPTVLQHISRSNGCDLRPQHWVMAKAKLDLFKNLCEEGLTQELVETENAMSQFTKKLREIALICIPKSSAIPKKPPVPWFDQDCIDAKKAKRRKQNRVKHQRTLIRVEEFKSEESACRLLFDMKKSKSWQSYVSGLTQNVNSKQVWDMIKKISGKNILPPIKPLKLEGGRVLETRQEICEELADTFRFHSSSENLPDGFARIKAQKERTPIHIDQESIGDEVYNRDFSMEEFKCALDPAKNTAPGPDDITYEMIRQLPDSSTETLLNIINSMWRNRTFPNEWKEAIIIPLPKPDKDHSNPSFYRPISLTSCLCKLMERMINNRLTWYLETNNLISRWQSGARQNRSTVDQLIRLETYVREAWARKEHVVSVFFDIEKAYDTAWKYGVIADLHRMGLRGNILAFIENYLSGRSFRVRLGAATSELKVQDEGYPQGGVLSVTLFKVRIDKLADQVPNDIMKSLFVDDFNINKSGQRMHTIVRQLQLAINRISKWCTENGFKLALSKTKCVHFCLKKGCDHPSLSIGDHQIEVVDKMKFLGGILDRKLTYNAHITDLKDRCSNSLNLLRVVSHQRWGADRNTRIKLYKALIGSRLDYGSILFSSACETHLKKLDIVQTTALRVCLGAFCTSPNVSLQVEANEPPLKIRNLNMALNYAISVKANPNNPASEALFSDYSTIVRDNCIPPCGHRLRQAFMMSEIDLDNIRPTTQLLMPRPMIEGINLNADLAVHPKESTPPTVFYNLFLEIRENKYSEFTHIYTDGSKKDEVVAAAVILLSEENNQAFRLPNGSSVYTAEAFAIQKALQFISNDPIQSNAVIFTDSLSCLQAIQGYETRNPVICDILNLLHIIKADQNKNVHICWIPGHVGIQGNEAADLAAKAALDLPDDEISRIKIPYSDFKSKAKLYCKNLWQTAWNEQNNNLRLAHPTIPYNFPRGLSRHEEWVLTRIHIGHTRFTHGHRLNPGEPPPFCEECDCEMSVEHILLSCATFNEDRNEFYQNIHSMEELFREVPSRDLLGFIKQIQFFHEI